MYGGADMRLCVFVAMLAGLMGMNLSGLALQAATSAVDADALLKASRFSEACDAYEAVLRADPRNAAATAGEVEASERLALQERSAGKM